MTSSFYPKTLTGLGACYTAGLPFLQNAMVGDLMYVGILFGVFDGHGGEKVSAFAK